MYLSASKSVWLMMVLVISGHFQTQAISSNNLHLRRRQPKNEILHKNQYNEDQNYLSTYRDIEDGSFGFQNLITIAMRVLPILFNAFSSGSTSSGPEPTSSDRIEELDIKDEPGPFSWSNIISTGIKVFLAIMSGSSSNSIDKSDASPIQAILGTIISALTGSENPEEVAVMAKQAKEVINLFVTLIEALRTSFTSRR